MQKLRCSWIWLKMANLNQELNPSPLSLKTSILITAPIVYIIWWYLHVNSTYVYDWNVMKNFENVHLEFCKVWHWKRGIMYEFFVCYIDAPLPLLYSSIGNYSKIFSKLVVIFCEKHFPNLKRLTMNTCYPQ